MWPSVQISAMPLGDLFEGGNVGSAWKGIRHGSSECPPSRTNRFDRFLQIISAIEELEQRLEVADREAKRREALLAQCIAEGRPKVERAQLQKEAKVGFPLKDRTFGFGGLF